LHIKSFKEFWQAFVRYNQIDFFPIRKNVKGYNKNALVGDMRAGFNVALLAFPQGMAYALIADIPIEFGIYGSIVATILGTFFAGNRFITLGPTNATSVLLGSSFAAMNLVTDAEKLAMLPILMLLVGIFLMVGAYFRVANLIHLVSRTVVTGYITGAALLIVANQIKNIIGIQYDADEKASSFVEVVFLTFKHIAEVEMASVGLSLITFILLYVLNKYVKLLPNVAITLFLATLIAVVANHQFGFEFAHLEKIDASQWRPTIPDLNLKLIGQTVTSASAIALLCILEGMSIGSSLAARSGSKLEGNQEMFNIGVANLGCAFFAGMPTSGSLTRSVLSWTSGCQTPIASLINGLLCLAGVFLIGGHLDKVPTAALAVLVIHIGLSLISRHAIRVSLKSTRGDALVFVATVLVALLFPLDFAIYFGTGLSIVLFLKKAGTPELVEYGFTEEGALSALEEKTRPQKEISIVHVEGSLFFGAAEVFRDQIRRVCEDPNLKIVILKMRNATYLDATGVMAMEELVHYMNERDRFLLVSECKKEHIRIFKNSGLLNVLNRKNVFPDNQQNSTRSTANALKRAQEILGAGEDAKISIFVGSRK